MKFEKVKSSCIDGFGYDEARGVLGVAFKSGSKYEYEGVKPEVYEGLWLAESKGRFFRANVLGRHSAKKVE